MFCKNCGKEIDEKAYCCPHCGVLTNNEAQSVVRKSAQDTNDAPSTGFGVLSFFIPLVGLILWILWKDTSPLKAKSCGKGALAGFITGIVLSVLYNVIVGIALSSIY